MMWLAFLAFGTPGFWIALFLSAIVVSSLVDGDRFTGATLVALGTFGLLALLGDFNPFALIRTYPVTSLMAVPVYFAAGVVWGRIKWGFYVAGLRRKVDAATVRFRERIQSEENEANEQRTEIMERRADLEKRGGRTQAETQDSQTPRWSAAGVTNPNSVNKQMADADEDAKKNAYRIVQLASEKFRLDMWQQEIRSVGIRCTVQPGVKLGEHKARIIAWMAYWPASLAWTLLDDPARRAFLILYENSAVWLQNVADRRFSGIENVHKAQTDTAGR